MTIKGLFYIYKNCTDQPVFILRDPNIALIRKLKYERKMFIIPVIEKQKDKQ